MIELREIIEVASENVQNVNTYRIMRVETDLNNCCFKPGIADRFLMKTIGSFETDENGIVDTQISIGSSANGLLKHFFLLYGKSCNEERENEESEMGYPEWIRESNRIELEIGWER